MTPTTPPRTSAFWQSPALKFRSKNYPFRFYGLVPMRIRMTMDVKPDWPCLLVEHAIGPVTILKSGYVYEAWTNSHGAVCGICPDGYKLGVKPHEFVVTEWYDADEDKVYDIN